MTDTAFLEQYSNGINNAVDFYFRAGKGIVSREDLHSTAVLAVLEYRRTHMAEVFPSLTIRRALQNALRTAKVVYVPEYKRHELRNAYDYYVQLDKVQTAQDKWEELETAIDVQRTIESLPPLYQTIILSLLRTHSITATAEETQHCRRTVYKAIANFKNELICAQ